MGNAQQLIFRISRQFLVAYLEESGKQGVYIIKQEQDQYQYNHQDDVPFQVGFLAPDELWIGHG